MNFPEAVEKIAEMAGVPMPVRDAAEERREKERASLTDVMEMATAFFQERLQGPEGAKARAYLRDRGLTPATQQSFRLGYAPDSRNALKEYLAAKGDKRQIVADVHARYFGAELDDSSLMPGDHPRFGSTSFEDWLSRSLPQS